jgi:hypothetical protein
VSVCKIALVDLVRSSVNLPPFCLSLLVGLVRQSVGSPVIPSRLRWSIPSNRPQNPASHSVVFHHRRSSFQSVSLPQQVAQPSNPSSGFRQLRPHFPSSLSGCTACQLISHPASQFVRLLGPRQLIFIRSVCPALASVS